VKVELLRAGNCPNCTAPIQFASNAAAAQVCKSCNFVVARTDRDFRAVGRVADLVPLASPLAVGSTGKLAFGGPGEPGRMFRVAGRMQYDRADAPGSPWQEFYLELDGGAHWSWLAHAQGNFYLMTLYEHPLHLPTPAQAMPGVTLTLGGGETFAITERSARRALSGEGELPFPFMPGAVEHYADMSGPNGAFGTIDFGAGDAPPQVYFGGRIDPRAIAVDGGGPGHELLEGAPRTQVAALKCPGCGGDLPLADPGRSERIVCRYCGQQSDVNQGALVALRKLPLPATLPMIELGATGKLRGVDVTLVGFMVRGTTVDDERYRWREYLLYAQHGGFVFLMEEDGRWDHIVPIGLGDLGRSNDATRLYQGQTFHHKQTVTAGVENVLGEFYWKVEVGETVQATEWEGPGKTKISEESGAGEINCAYSSPISIGELRSAFGAQFKLGKAAGARKSAGAAHHLFWFALILLWLVVTIVSCSRAADKQVYSTSVPISARAAASGPAPSLAASNKGRFLADGTTKTSDLTIGAATTSAPAGNVDAVLAGLKEKIARCFPGDVAGSFKVVVTVGQRGVPKSAELKDVSGLGTAPQCARVAFLGAQFPSAPAGTTITVPVSFAQPSSAPAPAASSSAAPAEPDTAVFSEPFEVAADARNLKLKIEAPNLVNNWVGADVALVHEASGTVWEDSVELEYYSGVDDGESWNEGSKDKSLWYSRIPSGKYVVRIDPAFDAAKPAAGPLKVTAVSDTPAPGYAITALVLLVLLYFLSTALRRRTA
jgi:hypothetical protein